MNNSSTDSLFALRRIIGDIRPAELEGTPLIMAQTEVVLQRVLAALLLFALQGAMVGGLPTVLAEEKESQCISFRDAKEHVGRNTCVVGKVDHVYESRNGNLFINFCADWRSCRFSAVVFRSDVAKFPNLEKYEGKMVELRGQIKLYQGRAEMVINRPEQIRLAD